MHLRVMSASLCVSVMMNWTKGIGMMAASRRPLQAWWRVAVGLSSVACCGFALQQVWVERQHMDAERQRADAERQRTDAERQRQLVRASVRAVDAFAMAPSFRVLQHALNSEGFVGQRIALPSTVGGGQWKVQKGDVEQALFIVPPSSPSPPETAATMRKALTPSQRALRDLAGEFLGEWDALWAQVRYDVVSEAYLREELDGWLSTMYNKEAATTEGRALATLAAHRAGEAALPRNGAEQLAMRWQVCDIVKDDHGRSRCAGVRA